MSVIRDLHPHPRIHVIVEEIRCEVAKRAVGGERKRGGRRGGGGRGYCVHLLLLKLL